MSKFIYTLEMCRWGDNNNHSYYSGTFSTLLKALDEGLSHARFRAHKYDPSIYMSQVDGHDVTKLCTSWAEAEQLYTEITGKEWKEPEAEETNNVQDV